MANNTEYFYNGISLEPQSADPANPREGQVQFSDGTVRAKGLWQYKDGSWAAIGGSAGSLDIIYQADFNTDVDTSAFTTGNDAVFDNGGTIDGAIALETSSPISGAKSFKYTMSSSSTNDFIKSESITLDSKQKGQYVGISFYYTYDGDDDDITFIAYDDTNNEVLTDSVDLIKAQANPTRYSTSIYVPTDCSVLNYGFQVGTGNNTKILTIDDVELTTNPFVYKDLIDEHTIVYTGADSVTGNLLKFKTEETNTNGGLIEVTNSTHTRYTFTRACQFVSNVSSYNGTITDAAIQFYDSTDTFRYRTILRETGSGRKNGSLVGHAQAGDYLEYSTNTTPSDSVLTNFSVVAQAETEHVITPAKSNMEDWESFTPTGSWTTNTTYTGTKRRVGDTMELRVKVSLSGAPNVAQLKIDIPDSLSIDTSKIQDEIENITFGQASIIDISGSAYVGRMGYDSATQIDVNVLNSSTTYVVRNQVNATSPFTFTSGDFLYLEFKVPIEGWSSDASFLAAIPTQLTAYIKDIKSDGTDGGTFTSGAWQTRDLNTLEGDSSFVTLSSDQFTLSPGKYEIEARSCAYAVNRHKLRIANIDDSTYSYGLNNLSQTSGGVGFPATAVATVEITSSKTYEIQHRCSTTQITNGFGVDCTFGVDEVYSIVKITKVK